MRVKIHFFLCPAVCNILDLREPNRAEAKRAPKGGAGASGGVTREGVRSSKKTPGLKDMKVQEQVDRYHQVTHTVVQSMV
jgi:hypothetical protein